MSNYNQLDALRPNVGFLLKETAGYKRALQFDLSDLALADDARVYSLVGELSLTRTSRGIWVDGHLEGELPATCGRCLEEFAAPYKIEFQELFFYPPSAAADAAEYVVTTDAILDLVSPLREQVLLNVPMRPLCRVDCHGMCDQCGKDLNQGMCDCEDDSIDPRMASLQQLRSLLSDD